MYLQEESKRVKVLKVLKVLQKALLLSEAGKL